MLEIPETTWAGPGRSEGNYPGRKCRGAIPYSITGRQCLSCKSGLRRSILLSDTANVLPVTVPTGVADELRRVLRELSRVTGCRSVAVARRDGLLIVHHLAPGQDPKAIAALGVEAVGAVRGIAERLEQGEFEQAFIKCSQGTILAAEAGSDAVLIALYDRDADLSLAGLRIRATTRAIDDTLAKA